MEDSLLGYIIGSGGGVAILAMIIKYVADARRGKHDREKQHNADMKAQRDEQYRSAREALARMYAMEAYAAQVRNVAIEKGFIDELPRWPEWGPP